MFRPTFLADLVGKMTISASALWLGIAALTAQTPPASAQAPLSKEQQEKLKDRNRYEQEMRKLQQEDKLPEAIALCEKMLAIEREVFGNFDARVAGSLQLLAKMQEKREDFVAARKARQQILEINIRLFGKEHWQVTDAQLAFSNVDLLANLTPDQRRQLALAESQSTELTKLYQQGKFLEAIPLGKKTLEILKQVLGEKHPEYATSLNNLADLYGSTGDYVQAESLYRNALDLRKQVLGDKHPAYATSLNNLALLYKSKGDYLQAESLYRNALDLRKQVLGDKHPAYATSLHNLASLYQSKGDYVQAEPLYREALEIIKQVKGDKHLQYANSLNNLAVLYNSKGDYVQAEPLLRQALEINKRVLGDKHPRYCANLNNLAFLYMSKGDYVQAEPLYRQALEIIKHELGDKHLHYATCLNNMAALYLSKGDYVQAEPFFRQTLEIHKQVLGDKHPTYAQSLNNLALLYVSRGDYVQAEPLYRQALEIKNQALGDKHPDYATSLYNLAALYHLQGDYVQAESNLHKSLEIIRDHLNLTSSAQSERQQLAMVKNLRDYLDRYLSLPAQISIKKAQTYQPVFTWKGAVFARQQHLATQRWRPELAGDFAKLEGVSGHLASLTMAAPPPNNQEFWRGRIVDLTLEKERLEKELARQSTDFQKNQALRQLTPVQLQAALPAGVVLIDFLEYTKASPSYDKKGQWVYEPRLAAFIVQRDRPQVQLDLGALPQITSLVDQWREGFGLWEGSKKDDPARKLRQRIWTPLEPYLKDAQTILISPDGALARFPFAALPGKEPGTYLIEERAIAVVPVPQLLPALLEKPELPQTKKPSLLLVGEVDYGAIPGKGETLADNRSAPRTDRANLLQQWEPLPGSRSELVTVRDSFEERFPQAPVQVLRKDQATERQVKQSASQHRYLHFATHGFFAPAELKSALARTRIDKPFAGDLFTAKDVTGFHPGLLSGLVLAGANRPMAPDQDDGILTALEVAVLDLSRVELAVLSACETGLGETAGGEGLLSLQRAFQVAGAKSVVASLWKVDDQATRSLMIEFYNNLWKKKMTKLNALRQAQLELLREGVARGLVASRGAGLKNPEGLDQKAKAQPVPKRLPPAYWAAFVLSGDWR